jgi:alpha-L-fucosidase
MFFRAAQVVFVALLSCSLLSFSDQNYTPDWASLDTRPLPTWYDESKIGIFINWGVYSVPSFTDEWMWWHWKGDDPAKDVVAYMEKNYPSDWTYADFAAQFQAELYDPNEWTDLFSAAGAKYIVFDSKHHDGFTLWPSKFSFNWNAMDVGPKRDLLGDLATAIRNRTDIVFGLYHSMFEWFHPLYLTDKSNGFNTQYFPNMKTLPELREIVELYKPEVVWSDGDWEAPDIYWNSTGFLAWLYNDSPVKDTVVVNDRWGSGDICKHGGFYTCSDRYNPGYLVKHKWENAFTIDKSSWGFRRTANLEDYMTIEEILKQVVTTISTGGNVLINVAPTSYGKIAPIYEERLRQMGLWLQVNGEAIYTSVPWKYQNDTTNTDVWYTSSKDGKSVYASLLRWPSTTSEVTLGAVVSSSSTVVTLLASSAGSLSWRAASETGGIVIDVSNIKSYSLRSDWAWVFKLENISAKQLAYKTSKNYRS